MSKRAVNRTLLTAPALYGKIPAHGDFVARGLDRAAAAEIDKWLTAWLEMAKSEWGEAFEDNYRAAQPWLLSGSTLSAILIPSFDRVERLFPLLAVVKAGAKLQDLYDGVINAILERQSADELFAALRAISTEGEASDPAEWILPDSREITMPHPLAHEHAHWAQTHLGAPEPSEIAPIELVKEEDARIGANAQAGATGAEL